MRTVHVLVQHRHHDVASSQLVVVELVHEPLHRAHAHQSLWPSSALVRHLIHDPDQARHLYATAVVCLHQAPQFPLPCNRPASLAQSREEALGSNHPISFGDLAEVVLRGALVLGREIDEKRHDMHLRVKGGVIARRGEARM